MILYIVNKTEKKDDRTCCDKKVLEFVAIEKKVIKLAVTG